MRLTHILLFIGLSLSVAAQGPPITAGTPVMLGLEGRGIRTFVRTSVSDNAVSLIVPLGLPYNITPTWQIGTAIPFFRNATIEGNQIKQGIGDIAVFTKYQLYKRDGRGKTLRTIAIIRHTLPTGRTFDGTAVSSGAFTTAIGLINGFITTRYGLYFDIAYVIRSRQLPDLWTHNLSLGIPLLPHRYPQRQLNAYLELNTRRSEHFKLQFLQLSPGLQFIAGRRFLIETSFGYPIYQTPNSNLRYSALLGTRILL